MICALRRRFALTVFALVTACGGSELTVQAQPINSYRAYGEYHPASEDEAVVKKAQGIDPGTTRIRLFQEALPEGIVMGHGVLGVAPGYKHKLIGKFAYSSGQTLSKDALVLQVKKMCVATGANSAIILFQLVPNDHQDQAQAIEAVLIDYKDQVLGGETSSAH